jgi:hypothetical protein
MTPQQQRWLFWGWGPGLAFLLVLLAFLVNSSTGIFSFSLVGAAGFTVIAPMIQGLLLNTPRFRGTRLQASAIAFGVVLGLVVVALVIGRSAAPAAP